VQAATPTPRTYLSVVTSGLPGDDALVGDPGALSRGQVTVRFRQEGP
jgi:hypothetical protein